MPGSSARPPGPLVALGARLKRFNEFLTLGVKPNFADYSAREKELIRAAPRIFYPSLAYAPLLHAMGKSIYPSLACHLLAGDKIKQTRMLELLGLPHPRTRVYFGSQRSRVLQDFTLPLIAKTPRASALGRGVHLIRDNAALQVYLARNDPAYIQEYLPMERDIRVVVIGKQTVCAYWRQAQHGEFRHNLALGAQLDFAAVPQAAVDLAVRAAGLCGLDEVGVDVAWLNGQAKLIEFNMKFGLRGPKQAGIDIPAYVVREIMAERL